MSNSKRQDQFELLAELMSQRKKYNEPIFVAHSVDMLIKLAKSHANLAWVDCNHGLSDKQRKRQGKIEQQIKTISDTLGCKGAVFSYDPRGCTVKLLLRSGRTNDFNHEAYCVPTR